MAPQRWVPAKPSVLLTWMLVAFSLSISLSQSRERSWSCTFPLALPSFRKLLQATSISARACQPQTSRLFCSPYWAARLLERSPGAQFCDIRCMGQQPDTSHAWHATTSCPRCRHLSHLHCRRVHRRDHHHQQLGHRGHHSVPPLPHHVAPRRSLRRLRHRLRLIRRP